MQSQFRIAQLDKLYAKSDFSAILGDGNVYTWGGNIFSRLGIQSLNSHSQTPDAMLPMRIPLPEQICTVALGTYHVVAVSRTGAAYAWGKGNQGQLGIGKLEAEAGPTKVICHEPIKEASCGEHHTLVVLHSGRLKSCGSNLSHALGHSLHDSKDRKKRCKVF